MPHTLRTSFFKKKNAFEKNNYFFFILNFFYILFIVLILKIKLKKYYFNIFLNKKYFKTYSLS